MSLKLSAETVQQLSQNMMIQGTNHTQSNVNYLEKLRMSCINNKTTCYTRQQEQKPATDTGAKHAT